MPSEDQGWKEAFALIGELVLLHSMLDRQLNLVIIEVLGLRHAPMLEPVVGALDMRLKIDMLKSHARHLSRKDWRKASQTHAELLEKISKVRNIAAHVPLIQDKHGMFCFAPIAAGKLLKSIKLQPTPIVENMGLDAVREAIKQSERALKGGEMLIDIFGRVNAEMAQRSQQSV